MKAHRTDGVSLSFGLVFLFITGWWVLTQFVTLALPAVGWMVAVSLILFGLAGLVGAFRSGRGAVPAPTSGAPISAAPASGLPTGLHADIVRELMENQRTSGGVGVDDTRVERPPAPTAAFTPVAFTASPYATDHLTEPGDDDRTSAGDATGPAESAESAEPAESADGVTGVDAGDRTLVIDETPTTEIRAEGDGGRR